MVTADEVVDLAKSRGFIGSVRDYRRSGWTEILDDGNETGEVTAYIFVFQTPFYESDPHTNGILVKYRVMTPDLKRGFELNGTADEYGIPDEDLVKILEILQS